jgi:DNA-binding beta-propeller fold protein YncE
MLITPVAPPAPVPIFSGFDYVTVDAQRRRVYAAHEGSQALLIVNADTSQVLGQVRIGPVHGVAVDPVTGHVFTGNGDARSISEVDPVGMKELRSVDVDGLIDAIAYDPQLHRIYADEDDGTRIFVIDTSGADLKQIGVVALPGHKPEYLAIDPATHKIYQNIDNLNEYVVIDPKSLTVVQSVPTPGIQHNHPLQLDSALGHLYVSGRGGLLLTYDLSGKLLWSTKIEGYYDQCDLDAAHHNIACAGSGGIAIYHDSGTSLDLVATQPIVKGVHTVGMDPQTGNAWAVWASPTGDFIQGFKVSP